LLAGHDGCGVCVCVCVCAQRQFKCGTMDPEQHEITFSADYVGQVHETEELLKRHARRRLSMADQPEVASPAADQVRQHARMPLSLLQNTHSQHGAFFCRLQLQP
jgi:hypothetical protein